MCRLAYLHFDPSVSPERRLRATEAVLRASWDLGNRDGAGYVTWTPAGGTVVGRALDIEHLKWPTAADIGTDVLVHARLSTNIKALAYTHPFAAADAYLVHNGVVHVPDLTLSQTLEDKAKTENDSELILKAYLASDRKLDKALSHIAGMANVLLWDERRNVLSIYAHSTDFQIWRQDGITLVCQENRQSEGIIVGGLAKPYEFARVPNGRLVELPLEHSLTDGEWVKAMLKAVKNAGKVKRPTDSTVYYKGTGSGFADYANGVRSVTDGWDFDNGVWVQKSKGYVVNGRKYSDDGRLLSTERLSKKQRKLLRKTFALYESEKEEDKR